MEEGKNKGLLQTSVALRLQLSWVPKPSLHPATKQNHTPGPPQI